MRVVEERADKKRKDELDALQAKQENTLVENGRLQEVNSTLVANLAAQTELARANGACAAELAVVKAELDELRPKYEGALTNVGVLTGKGTVRKAEIARLTDSNTRILEEHSRLSLENTRLTDTNARLTSENAELFTIRTENDSLRASLAQKSRELMASRCEVGTQKAAADHFRALLADEERKVTAGSKDIKDIKNLNTTLTSANETKTTRIEVLTAEKVSLEAEVTRLRVVNANQVQEISNVNGLLDQAKELLGSF